MNNSEFLFCPSQSWTSHMVSCLLLQLHVILENKWPNPVRLFQKWSLLALKRWSLEQTDHRSSYKELLDYVPRTRNLLAFVLTVCVHSKGGGRLSWCIQDEVPGRAFPLALFLGIVHLYCEEHMVTCKHHRVASKCRSYRATTRNSNNQICFVFVF